MMNLPLVFICSLFAIAHGVHMVSRGTYDSSSSDVVGPDTTLTINNQVVAPDGFSRSATLAGGIFPGPLIQANKGDDFNINVVNQLTDPTMWLSTSVHWHGIFQNGTSYADGPAFVTQCPIAQNNSFLYQFNAENQTGTYWYHSHYTTQQCDGLKGALVIYDPYDPYQDLYDVDDETTVITLSDWYHTVAHVLNSVVGGVIPDSVLINGLGRYPGGPESDLAVISVQYGQRYRFRLIAMACEPYFIFTIDEHSFTVIEADGVETLPLLVDSLQIFPGQRYSIIMNATQPVDNYWIRAVPNRGNSSITGGLNSAIMRYDGAPDQDPETRNTTSVNPLLEQNLHALVDPEVPGVPGYGNADINIDLSVENIGGAFFVNGVQFIPPTVPVLLQILNGSQQATDLLPSGSVYVLAPNQVVELTVNTSGPGGPHPIHIHGHDFHVVQSAGDSAFNYIDPVRRDVTSSGLPGERVVFRFVTDNAGPWFLHCHIDWHLHEGFAVVFAEDPAGVSSHLGPIPQSWDDLCPIFDALTPPQIGAISP